MKTVVIATNNRGKIAEFEHFFAARDITVRSLKEFSELPDIIEDGATFEANAIKKATTLGRYLNQIVIADDSGLAVEALDGRPGIYSARYAGADKDDDANNEKLLEELAEKTNRQASFICVIAVYFPNGTVKTVRGSVTGEIASELSGTEGFGYDPLFYYPPLGKTFAHLTKDEKNNVSHRADALKKMTEAWDTWLKEAQQ
ncbi:XTP/dITP diphosphatase [Salisediminibacterium halotolerans]|uniref:dITP/XTP pyrophosphatase n=1 Tax=Salisediminibacterium halotolerans TaxID=517425 RepID=A0A1H9U2S4_9BACI|nr:MULTISPECIES: XTP/dITP diphosphatase [Salisediminibacterium]RLJ81110.1 XTP/dITP diphosphohydrolase [Actinophytocola xinjiangensis]RPE84081.1 XTP/dITP diphosphohydrolase [Salisediminibacterium halotolerans]TWG38537.1 XTP/dITP diphosphohydrolase [Salisediminibacterium halotolerans]SES03669.1 XTP/dITP diphosphohydrolase [Salisediminibacterium haloalkalitolerans]GEL07187.1 non-canonical purine NTP pyrophosphatase [Salisediminibacterium halotolerans]